MKKKILSLLAAFFMLFGTSAMAQVDSTLEGDVNGDGVVDIADITAVIAIIKQNAEANPTYYFKIFKSESNKIKEYNETFLANKIANNEDCYQSLPLGNYTIENTPAQIVIMAPSSWSFTIRDERDLGTIASGANGIADSTTTNTIAAKSDIIVNDVKYTMYRSNAQYSGSVVIIK